MVAAAAVVDDDGGSSWVEVESFEASADRTGAEE